MSAVFNCPHCEKTYPNNPALIGRKVRCSGCKKVFQLQGDGTASKIEIPSSGDAAHQQRQVASAAAGSQQLSGQTKRQLKKSLTAKLERSRSSLREAAAEAVAAAQEDVEKETAGIRKEKSKKQALAKNVQIHRRSHTHANQPRFGLYSLIALVACIVLFVLLRPDPVPEKMALEAFSKIVDRSRSGYPDKMDAYRERMWLYARDGVDLPPIIVNAEKANIVSKETIDWSNLVSICQRHFSGMSILPFFAIMVQSDKQAQVEQLWEQFDYKYDIYGFYDVLEETGIQFIKCKSIPDMLLSGGLSKRDIYLVSLLLVGTRDAAGNACYDFGLVSSIEAEGAQICEFQGTEGMQLIDRGNEYAVAGSAEFCGLLVGFQGVQGVQDGQFVWRVLDLRYGESMEAFYDFAYNPFMTLSQRAMNHLQRAYANPNFEERSPIEGDGNSDE